LLVLYSGRDLKTRIDASMQDHLASIRRKAPAKRAPKAHVAALSGPRHSLGLAVSNTIGTQHHSSLTRKRCRFRSSANSIEIGSRYVNLRLSCVTHRGLTCLVGQSTIRCEQKVRSNIRSSIRGLGCPERYDISRRLTAQMVQDVHWM